MYAIVDIAGQQFKVEKDQQIFVHQLDSKEGEEVIFDNVLLIEAGSNIKIGTPNLNGAKVTAKVLEHLRGDKVVVFKKKRRKGYRVKNGHRQHLTKIEIQKIDEKGVAKKKSKPAVKKVSAKKPAVKKVSVKKPTVKKASVKKPTVKKASAKKPTVKKASAKKPTVKKASAKKPAAKKTDVKKITKKAE